MDNVTVGLSQEYAKQGVRVVGVAPGPVGTPLWLGPSGAAATIAARTGSDLQSVVDEVSAEIPVGRFTTPEEVGDLVAFLASARAGTITGTTIRIDGGITPSV
jgi:NAD(P)-dependent dehydrogenase (short-subunit alcohol dehydrogenase family)